MSDPLQLPLPEVKFGPKVLEEWKQNMYIPDEIARQYLLECYRLAMVYSKDPSTQNGAVLLDPVTLMPRVCAVNKFPGRLKETQERMDNRDLRLKMIDHAESNVIHKCAREGVRTHKGIMVAAWAACTECAKSIIGAGIRTLVTHQLEGGSHADWDDNIKLAYEMLQEHGTAIQFVTGKLDPANQIAVRRRGQLLYP